MDQSVLDGSATTVQVALERKKERQRELIASRRGDPSYRAGLCDGLRLYCAAAALHDLHQADLKRDYTRGTREHIREVQRFLSSPASEDEFELREMLSFVLGLLRISVEFVERQAEMQATSALSNLDREDLAYV